MTWAKALIQRMIALAPVFLLAVSTAVPAQSRTLDLVFIPPVIEPQNLCSATADAKPADNLTTAGAQDGLTDPMRLQYVQRDIRNLESTDANRWFDFIMTLIDWEAKLDPTFIATDVQQARIRLYVDAGRLDALKAAGLIEQLRTGGSQITNVQKMALAQYYLNGIGVAQDQDIARGLIKDAAYGGNAEALMSIARMDLEGNPVPGWDAPLDLTVTLAFGGMLGQMNAQVCGHAERIAREYLTGGVVTRNPDVAFAWYKFAADLGGAAAAWRVVEMHLDANADRKDNVEMLHYLKLAVDGGITVNQGQADKLKSAGQVDEATLRQILGYNFSEDTGRSRPSVSPYFQLSVNIDGQVPDANGPYLEYLRELTKFDTAPGWVFTRLANEVLIRKGQWAGEAEATALLEIAAERQDPEGMQLLGKILVRYRNDPTQLNRAINLLTGASGLGIMTAMNDLDSLYRCQAVDAPRLPEADVWAANYRATQDRTVEVTSQDLISLDPYKKPEMLALIQTQALAGRPVSLANYLERVQLNPFATVDAQRLWAGRVNQSDKALEVFGELEFALSSNPAERNLAVELFRRIYLNNGVTSALDLGVALTEDDSRDPAIAKEIIDMLTKAGNRGEGAAIRLKARLLARTQPQEVVYQEFKTVIEERGDFLALMFAIPYVDKDKAADYLDRAVALMNCGTKDSDELGDAGTILLDPALSDHWRQVGLTFDGGHLLSKLNLSNPQLALFDTGPAPTAKDVYARNLADGDRSALRNLFSLSADPDLKTYDPEAAVGQLTALLKTGNAEDEAWVLANYRLAGPAVRALMTQKINMKDLYGKAAQRGDPVAKLDLALMLRDTATGIADLKASARWLQDSAEAGNVGAMTELGEVLASGIGVPQDRKAALVWLEKAAAAGDNRAKESARIVRLEEGM